MTTITTYEIERTGHGDAGEIYEIRYPKCGEDVVAAEHPWWEATCSCGYRWSVEVKATGHKDG